MFENPRRGRQERNFTTNVPKILDFKSSSEQKFSKNWLWVPLIIKPYQTVIKRKKVRRLVFSFPLLRYNDAWLHVVVIAVAAIKMNQKLWRSRNLLSNFIKTCSFVDVVRLILSPLFILKESVCHHEIFPSRFFRLSRLACLGFSCSNFAKKNKRLFAVQKFIKIESNWSSWSCLQIEWNKEITR